MIAWLLDDGPFGDLAMQFDLTWPAETIHLVHEVADAARRDSSGRRPKLLTLGAPGPPVVKVHRTRADSDASAYLMDHLRPNARSTTKNMGEDVAIALAVTELHDMVFVTQDKQAAFIALAELGRGRVATPLDERDTLTDKGARWFDSPAGANLNNRVPLSVKPSIEVE